MMTYRSSTQLQLMQLTDQELLLSTNSVTDLIRKHSGVWEVPCGQSLEVQDFYSPVSQTNRPTGQSRGQIDQEDLS
jgi:hypothetical protein